MTLDELIPVIARFLTSHRISYFTFGGVGVSLWGEPRTTRDLDLVVRVERGDAPALVAGLNDLGFRITRSLQRKFFEGRIIRLPIGLAGLDLKLCATDHDFETLARARQVKLDDFKLAVAMPEDIVLYKLQTWRRQDQADIENLLANAKGIDIRHIEDRVARIEKATGHPMRKRWREFRPRAV